MVPLRLTLERKEINQMRIGENKSRNKENFRKPHIMCLRLILKLGELDKRN